MATKKGAALEELARSYFHKQGYFAMRGVPYRFEGDEVTDVDVWLYGRQAASGRIKAVVDAKDKRSPKALERILWTKGLQSVTSADRAIVVTTESNPKVAKFAKENRVSVVTKKFLDAFSRSPLAEDSRISLDEFIEFVCLNPNQRQDGNWIARISDTKSTLISNLGFPAFNSAISSFAFFAERIETRVQFREQALRSAFLCASVACIALDSALERLIFDDPERRAKSIEDGITFGDTGDGRVQRNIDSILKLIETGMDDGKAISFQASKAIRRQFASVRADVISEYFSKDQNQSHLFQAARELDSRAHVGFGGELNGLSVETKSVLGVFADFSQVKRGLLFKPLADPAPPPQADIPRLI